MAVNDTVSNCESVANAAYLTIQPSGTTEWVIHNIDFGGAVEISRFDGTNEIIFRTESAIGEYACVRHVTNSDYLRVKNISGGTIKIGYDGVVTKA